MIKSPSQKVGLMSKCSECFFSFNPIAVLIVSTVLFQKGSRCLGMFHSFVSEDERLPLAFHQSFHVALLELQPADLPVPMSFIVHPIISQRVYSVCTVNHRGKPGPLVAGVVQKISWLVLMFLPRLLGTSRTDPPLPPLAFCFSRVTRTQPCQHPSPLLQRFFFLAGPVCGVVPTQIETCQCGLCLL